MSKQKYRILVTERLLMGAVGDEPASSVLCTSVGRGQLAAELANRWPKAHVTCHFLDAYLADRAETRLEESDSRVSVVCSSDFPEMEADLVALPCRSQGDGELTRERLQAGYQRLRMGGRLVVATDNPRDTWLGEQMKRLFRQIHRLPNRLGVVYSGKKSEELRKVKVYSCEFVFRDGPRLIRVFSRPGVFSHRHLDLGARALIESLEVHNGARVLDLGCGTGVVSLAAAQRAEGVTVLAMDANPRAVECTLRSAELNGLTNISAILNADALFDSPETFDLVVANPPYYSHFRIGEIFVRGAERALRNGGLLRLVTKRPDQYMSLVQKGFRDATISEVRGYSIVRAVREGSP